jgi:IS5 family transposase
MRSLNACKILPEPATKLIRTAEQVVQNTPQVLERTKGVAGIDPTQDLYLRALSKEIEHYCELGDRVIDQARRRVLQGEQVPTEEKIYSIFEPHTDLINRGKAQYRDGQTPLTGYPRS